MRIKKVQETTPLSAEVLNVKSTGTKNTYSCDYINSLGTYSTTEQVVGTWINNKPVYRKVVELGALPDNSQKTVPHNIANLGTVVSLRGMTTGDNKFPIPESRTSLYLDYQVGLWCNSTNIVVETGNDRTSTSAFAVIEYTKTTD